LISIGKYLIKVVYFGDQQVFDGATTYTCLMILGKNSREIFDFEKVTNLKAWRNGTSGVSGKIETAKITTAKWDFTVGNDVQLYERLKEMPEKLGDFAERMAQGIRTSANDIYVVDLQAINRLICSVKSKQLGKEVQIEHDITRLFLQGREIRRYSLLHSGKLVIVPYSIVNGKSSLISIHDLKSKFPLALDYLQENRKYLEDREHSRMRGSNWYAYVYPKNLEIMSQPKILVPDIANRAQFAFDESGKFAFTSGYGITLKLGIKISPLYVLGLLNSKLLDFYLKRVSTPMQNGFFRYFTQFIQQLPIRTINFSDPADVAHHDYMVVLVEQMLKLHQDLAAALTPDLKTALHRQIDATDTQIDHLVYDLYGLTDEEIQVVEGGK
jgi:hypothetical protein